MNTDSHDADAPRPLPPISVEMMNFLQWWDLARQGNSLPGRGALQIEKIAPLISRITIIDILSPDRMIFRLTGTAIDEQAGINPTGINVLDITPPEQRPLRSRRLWQMAETPCAGLFIYENRLQWIDGLVSAGVTVPVRSDGDGSGRQFMTYYDSYRPSIEREEVGSPITQNMPDRFAYVDIGNGVPDDGTGEMTALSGLLA